MTVRLRLRVPPLPNVRVEASPFTRTRMEAGFWFRASFWPSSLRWLAYLLRTASVGALTLGGWRLGNDLGVTGPFFLSEGLWSHWQLYFGLAAGLGLSAAALQRQEPVLGELLPGEEFFVEDQEPMPPSIPPTIESPCSVEVRRAIGY